MEKTVKKTPVVFYVGVILLCMVMVSTYMTNGLYARYTQAYFSQDGARVASFNVTITPDITVYSEMLDLGEIQPGEQKLLTFQVTNNSEVAVTFNVIAVNLTNNLPLNIPVKGTDGENFPIFSANLGPNESGLFTVQIMWDGSNFDPSAVGKTDILELKVAVVQLD